MTKVLDFNAAGVSFANRQKFLCGLQNAKKARLTLVREPGNPHDRNAIKILAHTTTRFMLGYVPRAVAAELAPIMDAKRFVRISDWSVVGGHGLSKGLSLKAKYETA